MNSKLMEMVNTFFQYKEGGKIDSQPLNRIADYLQNNPQSIQDLLTDQKYDLFQRRVDLSWIDNEPDKAFFDIANPNNKIDYHRDIRLTMLIQAYKDVADNMVTWYEGPLVDAYYFPIMFCYTQFLELLFKYYADTKKITYKRNSHSPLEIWNDIRNAISNDIARDRYNLVDSIMNAMNPFMKTSMDFRYYEDLKTATVYIPNSRSVNLYSIKILVHIIYDELYEVCFPDAKFTQDDIDQFERKQFGG